MTTEQERLQALTQRGDRIEPPAELVRRANAPDYEELYRRSIADIPGFWAEAARELDWFRPWDRVFEWDEPHARWFGGAQCNITVNCLDRHANGARAEKRALIWLGEEGEERVFNFRELLRMVSRFANALRSLGVRKGDRVCIYMPLTPEGMAAMLACARIGAIHSVIYAGLGAGSLRSRILDAGAKVVLTADIGYRRGRRVELKRIVDEALEGLDSVEQVVVWRRRPDSPAPSGPREHDLAELLAGQSDTCEPEVMDAEDPLFILYTSGTTGTPKGPVYVHGGYMVGTYYMTKIAYDLHEDDIYWCTSDIGWIVGHSSIVYGPWANGTTVLVREGAPDFPDPGISWEIVERYGVTALFTAPTTLRMFMKFGDSYPRAHDLTSLRLIICAGEPLNPEAQLWAYHAIGNDHAPICDNWWQTETAAPTLGTLPSMVAKPGMVGKPMPGVIAEVVDRSGSPVPPNTGGFLVLRSTWPHMMRTIWGDDERYRAYYELIPGAYSAGDVATWDADGYFAVLGRADDVLNVAGHRIGTADVESALVSHPAVAEAGVIGIPDAIKGENIKAFVTLRLGHQADDALTAALLAHVRHELGPIAVPAAIQYVDRLPKTRSGKIMRRVLKAQELGLDPGDITTIEE